MPKLSALDLAMFLLESPARPFNIGPLVLLRPPADFKGNFADKLHAKLLKRSPGAPFNYRLKMSLTSAPSVEPMADSNISKHVHRLTLKNASMGELLEKACALHETVLDRSGLLWQFYVIDGLADGRVALYGKAHHGIIDGRGFVKAITLWFSDDPKDKEVRAMWDGVPRPAAAAKERAGMVRRLIGAGSQGMARAASPHSGRTSRVSANKAVAAPAAIGLAGIAPLFKVAQDLRRWTDNVLGIAGSAGDLSLNLAKARASEPGQQKSIEKAASILRQAREATGLTLKELGQAIDLDDPKLLQQAEEGKAALPMEIVLRLAGVLGRRDPVPFAMKLARSYNPTLWKALDQLGIGSLVALAGRERELANLYRGNDAARQLSDADFSEVLGFTKTAFDMAVKFRAAPRAARTTKTAQA